MKILWLTLLASPTVQASTYEDVRGIIDNRCVVCHVEDGAAGFLPFESFEQILGNQDAMLQAIENGVMPYGDPNFADTIDGKALLDWLANGDDLNPPDPPDEPRLIDRDPRELTFADVESILRARCQGCHSPGGRMSHLPLTTVREVRGVADDAWEEMDEAKMPLGNRDFAFSVDGRVLMGWLRYSQDVGGWASNDDDDDDDDD